MTLFLRPGVLHFLSTFFSLDESSLLLNPDLFSLTPKRLKKGCRDFMDCVAYNPKNNQGGWEILHSALGIPIQLLKPKKGEKPDKYVLRLWPLLLRQQGIEVKISIAPGSKIWTLAIKNDLDVKKAMRAAKLRIEQSPTFCHEEGKLSGKVECYPENNLAYFQEMIRLYIEDTLEKKERLLFLVPHEHAVEAALHFLKQIGVTKKQVASPYGKGFFWNHKELHLAPILLLGVHWVPLRYYPKKYERVIIWNLPGTLYGLHVQDPLPNFIQMGKKAHKAPNYFKKLWQAADLFHFVRDMCQQSDSLFVSGVKRKDKVVSFLRCLAQKVTFYEDE